jgi:Zn finger protein HypA/HybF involved in hydrogenase expression
MYLQSHDRKKAKGLCRDCKNELHEGNAQETCRDCRRRSAEVRPPRLVQDKLIYSVRLQNQTRRHAERAANKICLNCPAKLAEDNVQKMCPDCRRKRAEVTPAIVQLNILI